MHLKLSILWRSEEESFKPIRVLDLLKQADYIKQSKRGDNC